MTKRILIAGLLALATAPMTLLPLPAPPPPPEPPRDVHRTELLLRSEVHSPMPGGIIGGYQEDTGLDIAGFRLPVYAIAAGTLDYSEPGHTRWTGRGDDDRAVRLRLDQPISFRGREITHVWYAHLSELAYLQPEEAPERHAVLAGEWLGTSGMANGSPHLHLGLLLDGVVDQRWGSYLLADEVREVLGDYRLYERLPSTKRPRVRSLAPPNRSLAPPNGPGPG
jgi:murein DD-endopeptidase MepM/ murein hydrolase activator NlpD